MDQQPTTQANLAIERVLERAAQFDRHRPAQHTLIMGGSAEERRGVLDRVEQRLMFDSLRTKPRIGRPFTPCDAAPADAKGLWFATANAAGLSREDDNHDNGLVRIQNAAGKDLFVAVIDDLDHVLRNWKDPGEALNLRWAMQNVNGLMVVAASEGPISTADRHEHTILAMTFATQMVAPMAGVR
ncbi:MAG: hypothetical protein F4018_12875 [Acidobacteria bacterium]|nr:hypothetical protein [Acidobacteriota bacterium]MYH29053.1 hypothetical protein [Acidobacteriota bacterium]MYK89146.1 hypothetical protein [Acidobacteriota bacterium]